MSFLAPFFRPRGVAVVGASRDPSKVGGSVLANLRSAGFQGAIVPVNARATTVQGLPAVASVRAVGAPVDLAVITVPAPQVLPALEECEAAGIAGAVVISAGFREIGSEGAAREAALRTWLRGRRIRVLGPNCLGWIRPSCRLNATFAPGMPVGGSIAFLSHSGALAVAILDWSRDRAMGFSLFASLGNQADLTEADILRAAADDVETRVIAAYIEGVADGPRFVDALRHASALKPVVVLKVGRSPEAARAVSSHTGALAGSDRAFDAALRAGGAVRARTVEELFDLARGLSTQPLPRGRRLLVVTNGGGLGIVATDAAREAGLAVAPLDPVVRDRLRAVLPRIASVDNPVDVVGDADAARYGAALDAIGPDAAGDALLVILTAQAATDAGGVARAVIGATRGWPLPVAAAFVGGARVVPGVRAMEDAGIPCYPFPERAVVALGDMVRVAERRRGQRPAGPAPPAAPEMRERLRALTTAADGHLGMLELAPLLEAAGIPVLPIARAQGAAGAAAAGARMGFPVALKIISHEISHKTEVGGVQLGLDGTREVAAAAEAMLARVAATRPDARVDGFLVQRMAPPGKELLVGSVRDPQFGPLIMAGLGGIYVEVFQDTSVRLAPVSEEEAGEMLDELRAAPLLHGVRGEPAVDLRAVAGAVAALSRLAAELPLAELEVNPLVARPDGVVAVDARARVNPGGEER